MKPLPVPQRGGSIEQLRSFLNVASDSDFVLRCRGCSRACAIAAPIPCWCCRASRDRRSPLFAAILRALLDPNTAPLRACRVRIATSSSPPTTAMCWPSTTSPACRRGFPTRCAGWPPAAASRRASFTPTRTRCCSTPAGRVILNGIEDIVSRPDLADRALFLTLEPIAEEKRRTEAELWSEFEAERPHILGALLDAVVEGLKRLPETRLPRLPRMADFATWATACETALWSTGTFWSAYSGNIAGSVEAVIDADPVADAIRTMMTAKRERREPRSQVGRNRLGAVTPLPNRPASASPSPSPGRRRPGVGGPAAPGGDRPAQDRHRDRLQAEGPSGTRTISITGTPKSPGPDGAGNFASVPSAPSAAMPKSKPANDLAAQNTLTQTPALTETASAQNFASAQKPFENRLADATDGTDAKSTAPSSPRVERRI